MRFSRLSRWKIGLLAASVAGLATPRAASVAAGGPAGHWHVTTTIKCVSNGYNIPACQAIAGSSFAAFSMQDATLTIHASSAYTVDSGGRFKGYGSSTIAESAAHHGSIPDCNPEKMVRRLWTGTCYSAWQGRGYIARGKTGMPDFWLQRGTTTIHGTSPYAPHRITFSQPSDGGIPAVAGTYTTSRYFAIYRLASVRGVTVRTVVTHSA